ncbi:MAG: hypothetical protein DDT20_01031 [Firmicutes bacterium]|nr:hypothetical protein [Bacillota bacterium]
MEAARATATPAAPAAPVSAPPALLDVLAACPPALKPALMAVGVDSDAGRALIATFMPQGALATTANPVLNREVPAPTPLEAPSVTPPVVFTGGFGATAPIQTAGSTPTLSAAAQSLREKLLIKLGVK